MGTASYVLIGTKGAMEQTFGSTCHGAGMVMSRTKAKKTIRGTVLRDQLKSRGILICAGSMSGRSTTINGWLMSSTNSPAAISREFSADFVIRRSNG
jgi:RNA-splicing ligase RtcB